MEFLIGLLVGFAVAALARRYAKRSSNATMRKIDAVIFGGGGPGEPN